MKVTKRVLFYKISDSSYLAVNTLTGAVDIVEPHIYRLLSGYEPLDRTTLAGDIIETLKRRGYLVDDGLDEEALLQPTVDICKKMKRRISYIICPTYSCNFKCTYCFEGSLTQEDHSFMKIADIKLIFSAVDIMSNDYKDRTFSVELFGGEPFLPKTKPLIREIFKEASKRALPISMVTNGLFLPRFKDELNANKELITSAQITLDGIKDIHDKRRKLTNGKGTFERVCNAINLLLDMQIRVMVRVNIDLQNIDSVPDLYDFMVAKNWIGNPCFACNLSPIQDHTLSKGYEYLASDDKLVKKIFEMFKKNPEYENVFILNMFRNLRHIMAVLKSTKPIQPLLYYCESNNLENLVFGPDGYIYPCTECIGKIDLAVGEFRPSFQLYDQAINMWSNRNVLTVDECRECDIALLCGGGCAYSAIAANGDINKPVCNKAHETIFAYLDYMKDELASLAEN